MSGFYRKTITAMEEDNEDSYCLLIDEDRTEKEQPVNAYSCQLNDTASIANNEERIRNNADTSAKKQNKSIGAKLSCKDFSQIPVDNDSNLLTSDMASSELYERLVDNTNTTGSAADPVKFRNKGTSNNFRPAANNFTDNIRRATNTFIQIPNPTETYYTVPQLPPNTIYGNSDPKTGSVNPNRLDDIGNASTSIPLNRNGYRIQSENMTIIPAAQNLSHQGGPSTANGAKVSSNVDRLNGLIINNCLPPAMNMDSYGPVSIHPRQSQKLYASDANRSQMYGHDLVAPSANYGPSIGRCQWARCTGSCALINSITPTSVLPTNYISIMSSCTCPGSCNVHRSGPLYPGQPNIQAPPNFPTTAPRNPYVQALNGNGAISREGVYRVGDPNKYANYQQPYLTEIRSSSNVAGQSTINTTRQRTNHINSGVINVDPGFPAISASHQEATRCGNSNNIITNSKAFGIKNTVKNKSPTKTIKKAPKAKPKAVNKTPRARASTSKKTHLQLNNMNIATTLAHKQNVNLLQPTVEMRIPTEHDEIKVPYNRSDANIMQAPLSYELHLQSKMHNDIDQPQVKPSMQTIERIMMQAADMAMQNNVQQVENVTMYGKVQTSMSTETYTQDTLIRNVDSSVVLSNLNKSGASTSGTLTSGHVVSASAKGFELRASAKGFELRASAKGFELRAPASFTGVEVITDKIESIDLASDSGMLHDSIIMNVSKVQTQNTQRAGMNINSENAEIPIIMEACPQQAEMSLNTNKAQINIKILPKTQQANMNMTSNRVQTINSKEVYTTQLDNMYTNVEPALASYMNSCETCVTQTSTTSNTCNLTYTTSSIESVTRNIENADIASSFNNLNPRTGLMSSVPRSDTSYDTTQTQTNVQHQETDQTVDHISVDLLKSILENVHRNATLQNTNLSNTNISVHEANTNQACNNNNKNTITDKLPAVKAIKDHSEIYEGTETIKLEHATGTVSEGNISSHKSKSDEEINKLKIARQRLPLLNMQNDDVQLDALEDNSQKSILDEYGSIISSVLKRVNYSQTSYKVSFSKQEKSVDSCITSPDIVRSSADIKSLETRKKKIQNDREINNNSDSGSWKRYRRAADTKQNNNYTGFLRPVQKPAAKTGLNMQQEKYKSHQHLVPHHNNEQKKFADKMNIKKDTSSTSLVANLFLKFQIDFFGHEKGRLMENNLRKSAEKLSNEIQKLINISDNEDAKADMEFECPECHYVSIYSPPLLLCKEDVHNLDELHKIVHCQSCIRFRKKYKKSFVRFVKENKNKIKEIEKVIEKEIVANSKNAKTNDDTINSNDELKSHAIEEQINSIKIWAITDGNTINSNNELKTRSAYTRTHSDSTHSAEIRATDKSKIVTGSNQNIALKDDDIINSNNELKTQSFYTRTHPDSTHSTDIRATDDRTKIDYEAIEQKLNMIINGVSSLPTKAKLNVQQLPVKISCQMLKPSIFESLIKLKHDTTIDSTQKQKFVDGIDDKNKKSVIILEVQQIVSTKSAIGTSTPQNKNLKTTVKNNDGNTENNKESPLTIENADNNRNIDRSCKVSELNDAETTTNINAKLPKRNAKNSTDNAKNNAESTCRVTQLLNKDINTARNINDDNKKNQISEKVRKSLSIENATMCQRKINTGTNNNNKNNNKNWERKHFGDDTANRPDVKPKPKNSIRDVKNKASVSYIVKPLSPDSISLKLIKISGEHVKCESRRTKDKDEENYKRGDDRKSISDGDDNGSDSNETDDKCESRRTNDKDEENYKRGDDRKSISDGDDNGSDSNETDDKCESRRTNTKDEEHYKRGDDRKSISDGDDNGSDSNETDDKCESRRTNDKDEENCKRGDDRKSSSDSNDNGSDSNKTNDEINKTDKAIENSIKTQISGEHDKCESRRTNDKDEENCKRGEDRKSSSDSNDNDSDSKKTNDEINKADKAIENSIKTQISGEHDKCESLRTNDKDEENCKRGDDRKSSSDSNYNGSDSNKTDDEMNKTDKDIENSFRTQISGEHDKCESRRTNDKDTENCKRGDDRKSSSDSNYNGSDSNKTDDEMNKTDKATENSFKTQISGEHDKCESRRTNDKDEENCKRGDDRKSSSDSNDNGSDSNKTNDEINKTGKALENAFKTLKNNCNSNEKSDLPKVDISGKEDKSLKEPNNNIDHDRSDKSETKKKKKKNNATVKEEYSYICPKCSMPFSYLSCYYSHMRYNHNIHDESIPKECVYKKCAICGLDMVWGKPYQNHIRTYHNNIFKIGAKDPNAKRPRCSTKKKKCLKINTELVAG